MGGVKISTKKIESKAIDIIRNLIDDMEDIDRNIPEKDTGISWDGDIQVYNGNIDKKSNLSAIFRIQVKGRTINKLPKKDNYNYYIDRIDLENYLKDDGTIFFVVLFSKNGYKAYFIDLLPYNLRYLLKNEANNSKKKIKVKMKEIKSASKMEIDIKNFAIDREKQKKISDEVFDQIFNQENSFVKQNGDIKFFSTKSVNDIRQLVGEEKYLYKFDENRNIVGIEIGKLVSLGISHNTKIYNYKHELCYDLVIENITSDNKMWIFGKVFSIDIDNRKFHIDIKGTLAERIKQINFIIDLCEENQFYINEIPFKLNEKVKNIDKYKEQLFLYCKIDNFIKKHKINKDINLDMWDDKEINDLLIWIDAIENKIPIFIKECTTSILGSIKIKDIRFSVFATKREDDEKFIVYSLWGDIKPKSFMFGYQKIDGEHDFETMNLFDVLNKEAYCSDDIDYEEMMNFFTSYDLQPHEEILINLQALEAISAYDIIKDERLLNYAEFLLNKIINIDSIKDIAFINFMQIKKRKMNLSSDDNEKLILIKNKYIGEKYFELSINLLLDNEIESQIQFKKLSDVEKNEYKKFPISKFLKEE